MCLYVYQKCFCSVCLDAPPVLRREGPVLPYHFCIYQSFPTIFTYTSMYELVCVHMCLYVCLYVCFYVCLYVCLYVCICACMCVCMCEYGCCMCACVSALLSAYM